MMQTLLLFLAGLLATSAWVVVAPAPLVRPGSTGSRFASVCMQEDAPSPEAAAEPAAPPAGMADFTEDLLDALAADDLDESPLGDSTSMESGKWVKPDGGEELLPLPSYVNALSVEEARDKYKLHPDDCGSTQVQVAVLTARIAYMTKHMQQNKKDYASLRGLNAMVTRRRKLLEYLLKNDVPEFKRITSELNIRTNQLLKPKLAGARGRRV